MKRCLLLVFACFQAFLINAAATTIERPSAADLAVESIAASNACVQGKPCTFHVIIRNQGSAAYRGPIVLSDEIQTLTLLAETPSSPWTCQKTGRGQYSCRYPYAVIEPGRKLSLALALKVIGTSLGRKEHCGTIEWSGDAAASRNQAVRERLSQIGYTIRDGQALTAAIRDIRTKAGIAPGDQLDKELAASLIGRWGEGDSFAGNDRGCVAFELLEIVKKPLERCRLGEGLVDDKCVSVANYCPGGQIGDLSNDICRCPADRPLWSAATSQCLATDVSATCRPGQSMAKGECLCPKETPVWNVQQSRCMAVNPVQLSAENSKTDLLPSCTGGRVLNRLQASCVCPPGLLDLPEGCVRPANASPPRRPVIAQANVVKRPQQEVRRTPTCSGLRVWNESLGRCTSTTRVAARERQCSEGQLKRNGKCIWPKRARTQVRRKPEVRAAARPAVRKPSASRTANRLAERRSRCTGLLRWSKTLRHCAPIWIIIP